MGVGIGCMTARQIYIGAVTSLSAFALVLVVAVNWSAVVSKSELATNAFLALAGASALGCAYFLPRSVRVWFRRRRK